MLTYIVEHLCVGCWRSVRYGCWVEVSKMGVGFLVLKLGEANGVRCLLGGGEVVDMGFDVFFFSGNGFTMLQ